jgi:hypothetical protein
MCMFLWGNTHQIVAVRFPVYTTNLLWSSYRSSPAVCDKALHSCLADTDFRNHPHLALCLVRVYALYSRSRLVLGFLLTISLGLFINIFVCIFFSLSSDEAYTHHHLFFEVYNGHKPSLQ